MLALTFPDVRGFMVKLLKEEVFDEFQLRNAVVNTFARFEVYGGSEDGCALWGAVRPHVFGIIRGGEAPRSMKIIFGKEEKGVDADNPISFFVNIHFENGKVNLTTGISKKGFTLDRSDDDRWNADVIKFLDDNKITYTNEI